ncbi:seryl-tRNA synthetase [Candidatus Kinetoplastibacterium desouzaii TCC079E]|uniref:Serine--tRNA ligase n=1 Tax=Candidatus Kinetoplastidibacterium desouzai TCC079E TaxID=1208919 RepID=M1LUU0_9PROT|nr:serine--tRNA ligase [Candidatus Kinetoplastibacterium desouzaii]AGF47064.1 seryl-tRNA synthetase [Candidatus Kinetoplastibacterium desouzaii TCC079E]
MLDIGFLRSDPQKVAKSLLSRGFDFNVNEFERVEFNRKKIQQETESLQARRNVLAKQIGFLKSQNLDADELILESQSIPGQLKDLEKELSNYQILINDILLSLPNLPHSTVPLGLTDKENIEIRRWYPENVFPENKFTKKDFDYKDHISLGERLGLDLTTGVKMSGSRFSFMRGKVARLHRALSQFMLDLHVTQHGYTECYTPYIVNSSTLIGTGQLPKFKEDMFSVRKYTNHCNQDSSIVGDDYEDQYLISTSEITLIGSVSDSIVSLEELPIKLTAHTPCFRSEAGSGGRDIKGIIRQHQFDKVELVQIVEPKRSYDVLEDVLSHAERVLQLLELPYRVVLLSSGDMGFCAAKTYDLEVWLPSQQNWREISSVSNCESFQARRMKARFRNSNGSVEYLHTINGSGLAVGRSLVAVLENYQNSDGSITVPVVLRAYMGGESILTP